jgi:hypothetical protein
MLINPTYWGFNIIFKHGMLINPTYWIFNILSKTYILHSERTLNVIWKESTHPILAHQIVFKPVATTKINF